MSRLLGSLVVLALLLAACGADDGDDAAAPDDSEVDESSAVDGEMDLREAEAFYEGATLTWIVPYDPGGGHDRYPRYLVPYLEEELGANIVVENQPGAGGLQGTNNLLSAEPDGLTMGNFSGTGILSALLAGVEGVRFELEDITWLGRFLGEPQIITAAADGPYQSWDDVLAADEIRLGADGPGTGNFYNMNLLNMAFDLEAPIITGFDGAPEGVLAMLRGDVDLYGGSLSGRLPEIEAGDTIGILSLTEERVEPFPDMPTVFEFDLDDSWETIFRAHAAIPETHRPIVVHSDVPEDRKQVLRNAVAAALTNPDFVAEVEGDGHELDTRDAEWMEEQVEAVLQAPESYREILADLS